MRRAAGMASTAGTWRSHRLGQRSAPAPVPLLRREWTTTGRLSVRARGLFALTDPSGRLRPWLRQVLAAGAHQLARSRGVFLGRQEYRRLERGSGIQRARRVQRTWLAVARGYE